MKYPALRIAMAYAAGLLAADCLGAETWKVWLPAAVLLLVVLALARAWKPFQLCCWGLAGVANLLLHTVPLSPADLRHLVGADPVLACVRGRLMAAPKESSYLKKEKLVTRYLTRIEVSEIQVGRGRDWQSAKGRLLITSPEIPEGLYAGQGVEVAGLLGLPPTRAAEGLFDYRAYLKRHGIYFRLQCDSSGDWRPLEPRIAPPASDRFIRWAQKTLARGLPEQDHSLRLLWSMTLGIQEELPADVYQPFLIAGTMHVFAISGLHIALIGGVIIGVLQLARTPRVVGAPVMIASIWAYTFATGWQPSAIRSTVMMTIVGAGWLLNRPGNLLNSLMAAGLLILLWDPQQFFGASFQLSFLVVLAIAVLLPWFEARRAGLVERLLDLDELLPEELIPPWKRALRDALCWAYSFSVVSLAAWIGSAPLIAQYFHLFSLSAIVANLLVVPLSSLALAANMGSLAVFWTPFCEPLNHSAWFLMRVMVESSAWIAGRNWGFWFVPEVPWLGIILYYPLLVVFAWWSEEWLSGAVRRWLLTVLAIGGISAVCITWWSSGRCVKITALPLRGGMATFVDAPGRAHDVLVDAGDEDAGETTLQSYLKGQGVNGLSALVLTHGDLRHVGGAPPIVGLFRPKHVYASALKFRSTAYRKIVGEFDARPDFVRRVHAGSTIGAWSVLHPLAEDKFTRADDGALVLFADVCGTRVLLLSDLGGAGQQKLLARHPDLRADIVVAGLAADRTALGAELLDAVRPELVVVCDTEAPFQERAPPELHERLAESRVPVWFTAEAGTVTFRLRDGHWEARAMNGATLRRRAVRRGR